MRLHAIKSQTCFEAWLIVLIKIEKKHRVLLRLISGEINEQPILADVVKESCTSRLFFVANVRRCSGSSHENNPTFPKYSLRVYRSLVNTVHRGKRVPSNRYRRDDLHFRSLTTKILYACRGFQYSYFDFTPVEASG